MTASPCGALLGLAVGDALGTTNEFERLDAPPFPELATEELTDIVGGGPFGLKPGQVTDDTQMACCLYSSLASLGHFDAENVAARYVKWSELAFDIGNQTSSALAVIAERESALEAGRIVWQRSGSQAAGNGSLMRTAPIGAIFAASEHERRIASLDDSAITHSIRAADSPAQPSTRRSRRAFSARPMRTTCGGPRGTNFPSPRSSSPVNTTANWIWR
jgi:ADP-ribosylglycohydrolase